MIQIILVATAILSLAGGAAAFLFVIWPSIRNQERRAARLEQWIDSAEGAAVIRSVKAKISSLDAGGQPTSKDAFLRESDQCGSQPGTVNL
jgi:hypothetical protein